MMLRMRLPSSFLLTAFLLAVVPITAQQSPSPAASGNQASELEPLFVCDWSHTGDLDLSVDVDATGTVSSATVVSGDAHLEPAAFSAAKLLRHPGYASKTGVLLHVIFVGKKTSMKMVYPAYPPMAKAAHVGGAVEMVATIASDGHVISVTAVSGSGMLKADAIDALKQWIFPPAQQAGQPVQCHAVVIMNFNLSSTPFP
jgi:TonB family protein